MVATIRRVFGSILRTVPPTVTTQTLPPPTVMPTGAHLTGITSAPAAPGWRTATRRRVEAPARLPDPRRPVTDGDHQRERGDVQRPDDAVGAEIDQRDALAASDDLLGTDFSVPLL